MSDNLDNCPKENLFLFAFIYLGYSWTNFSHIYSNNGDDQRELN